MKRRKRFFLLILIISLSISTFSFSFGSEAKPKYGGKLTIADPMSPPLLDPNKDGSYHSSRMTLSIIYEALLRIDPAQGNKLVPGLATSWETKSPIEYIFTLRKGVKFHNGRELIADDVKYSFERGKNPKTGSPFRAYLQPIKDIQILGPYKVRILLKKPYVPFLTYLAGGYNTYIVPKEEVEKHGDLNKVAVGTGPFKMVEYVPGSHMRLAKNKDYWRKGLPYLDEIILRVIKDESARIASVRTNAASITYISFSNVDRVKKVKGVELITGSDAYMGSTLAQFLPNCSRKPFTDKRVRQAMSLVIDRKQIIDTVLFGQGEVAGPIPPVFKKFALPVDYKIDISKAKRLMAEAGYANGFETTILAPHQYPDFVAYAQIIKENLKKIDIDAKINVVEWGVFLKEWKAGNYDTAALASGYKPDPDSFTYEYWHSKSPRNRTKFFTGELDQIVEEQREAVNLEKRKELLYEIQRKLLYDYCPNIYLYSGYGVEVFRDYVKGYKPSCQTRYYLCETWLDK